MGLATGVAFVTEYQAEATPRGRGFVALANMYQHRNWKQMGIIIEGNYKGMTPVDMPDRVKKIVNHLQREDRIDNGQHQGNSQKHGG